MSESLEDVYKVNETWKQDQMDEGNESTFYKKELYRSDDMGKEIFYWYY